MDWGLIIAAGGFGLAALGGLVAWVVRFTKAESSSETARTALAKAEALEKELAAFKVEVAQNYATASMVAAVEQSVGNAINRLTDRLDRILETRAPGARRRSSSD